MRTFLEECRSCMSPESWSQFHTEAVSSAGETFHIIEHMVFALTETQTPIGAGLRKALDAVIQECEIDRDRWGDLRKLNYDSYWRAKYGYDK